MTEKKMSDMFTHDPYTGVIRLADRGFMALYRQAGESTRRLIHLTLALLPLMALLVGSCKMSQMPWAYGSSANPEEVQTALFPDRINHEGARYYPAAGYILQAQGYV